MCSGIALYLTFADGEQESEVYSVGGQAGIVFDIARTMVLGAPLLQKRCRVTRESIIKINSGGVPIGKFEVLPSNLDTEHKLNISGLIFDEFNTLSHRKLWETSGSWTTSRNQPLTLAVTTTEIDQNSICWEVRRWVERVNSGEIKDDTFLGVISS